jgi:aminoglycoside phosphotransferase (APT) family kinase protein
MHDNEFDIDKKLVTNLLKQQCPELSNYSITKIKHYGTDNAIFRLGNEYAIRLPRINSSAKQLEKEQIWLPKLKKELPLIIPTLVKSGNPSKYFPANWYVYQWIEGEDAYNKPPSDLNQVAKDLAGFIKALWKINTDNAPPAQRGLSLKTLDKAVRDAIHNLKNTLNTNIISNIWQECLNAPDWNKPPVWLHADLLPSNLLLQNNKLHAVIDFGLMGIGDPACDLIPAWCLFDNDSRIIFKETLGVDEDTWLRGKGWALSIALIIIPYYLKTNPVLVSVARRIISEIIKNENA